MRSDDSGRRERTRPGFFVCVLCLFILLLKLLNVRRFPPPSSRTYELRYIGAETQEEGGTRCQRALAAEGDRGAEEIGQQEVAETASGCPKRWCWSKRRTGGTEDSLPCSWVEEGWLPSERERRSRPRLPGGRSLLPSAMFGEEQGTGDSLPAALDRRSHRRGAAAFHLCLFILLLKLLNVRRFPPPSSRTYELRYIYIHSIQTNIFQVFISFNFDDYN